MVTVRNAGESIILEVFINGKIEEVAMYPQFSKTKFTETEGTILKSILNHIYKDLAVSTASTDNI